MLEKKQIKAVAVKDREDPKLSEFDPINFYVFEGDCRKCGLGPYSLVIYDFKVNSKDSGQSIFKTQCLCCAHRDIHYSANVSSE